MTFEVGRLSAALTLDGVDKVTKDLDQVGVKFEATGKEAAKASGLWQDSAGKWRTASGQFASAADKAAAGVENLTKQTVVASQASTSLMEGIRKSATQNASEMNLVGGAFTKVGLAAAAASAVAITKWANFDQAMSNVAAATHESEANMRLLEQAALDAGARTVFSATEAAGAVEELAKAGVSTADILSGGLDGALDLAAAGGLGVADAAGIAATALKTFNLEGSQMGHVADLLAAGAGKAMGDVTDLSAALNQSSMVAKASGLSIEETTAALSAFASQGLLGSDAGTSFKTMLMSLQGPSGAAKQKMDELGISAYDSQGKFVGLANFAGKLQTALASMSDEQRQATLKTIFGSDAIRAATVLYSEGADGIREWEAAVNDQGYAAETASMRLDNLKGDIEALGGALDTALIQTGSGTNDALREVVQLITDVVDAYNELPAPLQSATIQAGLLLAVVGLLGGAFMTGTVKALEFRVALNTLAPAGSRARGALVGLGAAAIAFVAVPLAATLVDWMDSFSKATTKSGALTDSLKKSKDITAELTSGLAAAQIANFGEGWETTKAVDNLRALGTTVGDLQATFEGSMLGKAMSFPMFGKDSGLGDAKEQIRELDTALASLVDSGNDEKAAAGLEKFAALAREAGWSQADINAALPEYVAAQEAATAATEEGAAGTEQHIQSLETLAGVAQATGEDISDLADQIKGFGSAAFDVEGAAIKLRDEFRDLEKAAAEGWMVLDDSDKGDRTKQAFLDIASAANDSAGAILAMTGDQTKSNAVLADARQRIIDMRVALGESPEVAATWADQFVSSSQAVSDAVQQVADKFAALPAEKKLYIDAETAAAYEGIEGVQVTQIDDKTAVVVAETDEAMARINSIAEQQPPDKIFQITADAASAYAGIDGVNVRQIDAKTAYVWGNTADATQKINDINKTQTPKKIVTIDGNSSGFEKVWSSVVGRVGQAWVNVFGQKANAQGGMYSSAGQLFDDGGIVSRIGRQFDNGGFASGIYNGVMGGIPKIGVDGVPHLFAEKHLGVDWETYISSKSSKQRNAMLLMETAQRIGFPVIPAAALRGIRGFADGGTAGAPPFANEQLGAPIGGTSTEWNMTFVNPVVRDPFEDAWNQAQEKGSL